MTGSAQNIPPKTSYYSPRECIITATQQWRLHVPAQRYFNKALEDMKALLQPSRQCVWKASGRNYNGYQADLVFCSIETIAPTEELSYPDW
jgi:hypothetical protein